MEVDGEWLGNWKQEEPGSLPRASSGQAPQVAVSALQMQTQGGEVSADAPQLADGRRGTSNS